MADATYHRVRTDPILIGPRYLNYDGPPFTAGNVLLRCRCGLIEPVPAQRADTLVVAHRDGEWP